MNILDIFDFRKTCQDKDDVIWIIVNFCKLLVYQRIFDI